VYASNLLQWLSLRNNSIMSCIQQNIICTIILMTGTLFCSWWLIAPTNAAVVFSLFYLRPTFLVNKCSRPNSSVGHERDKGFSSGVGNLRYACLLRHILCYWMANQRQVKLHIIIFQLFLKLCIPILLQCNTIIYFCIKITLIMPCNTKYYLIRIYNKVSPALKLLLVLHIFPCIGACPKYFQRSFNKHFFKIGTTKKLNKLIFLCQ